MYYENIKNFIINSATLFGKNVTFLRTGDKIRGNNQKNRNFFLNRMSRKEKINVRFFSEKERGLTETKFNAII